MGLSIISKYGLCITIYSLIRSFEFNEKKMTEVIRNIFQQK